VKLDDLVVAATKITGSNEWPPALDLEALSQRDPSPPKFIVDPWVPEGCGVLISGHGGAGKSNIAAHFAVCNSTGRPFFGLPVERRRVLYMSCEDRAPVLHWRLSRICKYEGIDMATLHGRLDVIDLVGHDAVLWEKDHRTGDSLRAAYGLLDARIKSTRAEVLIVDGISDTYGGSGGSKTEVKRFVNALLALVPPTGAVLLVGHVSKATAANAATTEGYDGTAGWHNSVRARWYLYPETSASDDDDRQRRTGNLILELQKTNHGRADEQIRFRWDDDAHLFIGTPVGHSSFDARHRDRAEQRGILAAFRGCAEGGIPVPAAMQGPRTAYLVLSLRAEFPASLKGSTKPQRARFRRHIETLRQIRALVESEYRRGNRHAATQLDITPEGLRQCAE